MRYDEHPTWRMLESCKIDLKQMLTELPAWHPLFPVINEAHHQMVKLQYALEDKLCRSDS